MSQEIEFHQAGREWARPYNYSAAAVVGDLVFVSGQVGVDDNGVVVAEGDFLAQAHQAFHNVESVLLAVGSSMADIAKASIFLVSTEDFQHIPNLRKQYFIAPYPADTTVIVNALARPGLLIEIEVVALKRGLIPR
jgi:reactive intermediate/imine deaminase